MIPVDRPEVLSVALGGLAEFAARSTVRGRFIWLYLGLRRMSAEGTLAPLGSGRVTAAGDIQRYLDRMYTKRHRPSPHVVLTAPFGGSGSPYSPLTGITAPPRTTATNTWRNNFGIQKGVGCAAGPEVVRRLLDEPRGRLSCPHMATGPEGRTICSLRNTTYRGDRHSIWLRLTRSPSGYQVVDLDHPSVSRDYLLAADRRIPVFPLIATVYCMAPSGVYPDRINVDLSDFAADFGFTMEQVDALFDCDSASKFNAPLTTSAEAAPSQLREPPATRPGSTPSGDSIPDVPPDSFLNSGVGAEVAVARQLEAANWTVHYRANEAGLGYDLEARRDGERLCVEVKSSRRSAELVLQASEWRAARALGDSFVLAIVDNFGTEEQIWYVRNPASKALPSKREAFTYRFSRGDVESARTEVEAL